MSVLAQVKFMPSGLVARKLRLSPRSLGRIAGTVPLVAGDERADVGLNVRHGAKNLRVADAVAPGPDGQGWTYSPSLLAILQQYQVILRSHAVPAMPASSSCLVNFHSVWGCFLQPQPGWRAEQCPATDCFMSQDSLLGLSCCRLL